MYNRIYLGGTFDCLHRGHLNLFRAAHKVARQVVVGLNTDAFAELYKRRPVMQFADRLEVLHECRLVDDVIVNAGGYDSRHAILLSGADAIGHGDDWTGEALMKQMGFDQVWLDRHNIMMVYMPYTRGISSTQIRDDVFTHGNELIQRNGA